MGTSTNAEISYGILCEEDLVFPWDDNLIFASDNWWIHEVMGLKNRDSEFFTKKGNYKKGLKKQCEEHYKEKGEFLKENPPPFELVNTCSSEYPIWILAVPGTVTTVFRGHPKVVPNLVVNEDAVDLFKEFINKHLPELKDKQINWYLSSNWDY